MKRILFTIFVLNVSLALADIELTNVERDYKNLSFLEGCWSGAIRSSLVSESWGDQTGFNMFGISKTTASDKLRSFEFLRIEKTSETVSFVPYVNGVQSVHFLLTESTETSATFVNKNHDFPQVIQYERKDDLLSIKLSGQGKKTSYSLSRSGCDGSTKA